MSNPSQPQQDINAAQLIARCLNIIKEDEAHLRALFPLEESSIARGDDEGLPELAISSYVQSKLVSGYGHATALAQMLGMKPNQDLLTINAPPYGCYSLIRTVMECAAQALWVIAPKNRTKRLERRLYAHADEIVYAISFLQASESSSDESDAKVARLNAYSERIGKDFTPWKNTKDDRLEYKLPGFANMLCEAEKLKDPTSLSGVSTTHPWNALWRACSGAAHGSDWSRTLLSRLEPISHTRMAHTQDYVIHPDHVSISYMLLGATEVLVSALNRFAMLSTTTEGRDAGYTSL